MIRIGYLPDGIDLKFVSINNMDLFKNVVQIPDFHRPVNWWSDHLDKLQFVDLKQTKRYWIYKYRIPWSDSVWN